MKGPAAPTVSIGLPVYNAERFLSQALDSLLAQTLADFELVISDNASMDLTARICLEYAARDRRIRYIRQPSNIGAIPNWNFLARQARGRYFKWASANDYCDARMLDKCVAVLEADPGAVLCHGRTCMVDEDTGEQHPFEQDVSALDARPSERFRHVSRNLVLNNALCGVMRTKAALQTPLQRLYAAGDVVFTIELSLYGRIVLLPEVLFYRRFGRHTWSRLLKPADREVFLFGAVGVHPGDGRWRRRVDLFRAVLAAPIGAGEKWRTLFQAAQRAGGRSPVKALRRVKGPHRA